MADVHIHRNIEQSSGLRPLRAAVLLAGMCAVSACTLPPLRELAQSADGAVEAAVVAMNPSQDVSEDPLLVFLSAAEEGDVQDIDDAVTGARLRVTAGRAYHAASGRLCRRFSAGNAATPGANEGLVCKDVSGRWTRNGLLIPVPP